MVAGFRPKTSSSNPRARKKSSASVLSAVRISSMILQRFSPKTLFRVISPNCSSHPTARGSTHRVLSFLRHGVSSTNSSSMTSDAELEENIGEMLRCNLKKEPRACQKLKGGRNSKVFRVDCTDGAAVAVKAYFRSAQDQRDRMGCEFRALQLLQQEDLHNVAAPLAADEARQVAVYDFIEGQPIPSSEVIPADIEQVLDFLRSLKQIAANG